MQCISVCVNVVASTVVITALSGCRTKPVVSAPIGLIQDHPQTGWRMYGAPNTGNSPGSVILVNSDGVRYPEGDASGGADPESFDIALPEAKLVSNRRVRLGSLYSFITSGLPAQVSGNFSSADTVKVSIQISGAIQEQFTRQELASNLKDMGIATAAADNPSNSYYVILASIAATEINFSFETADVLTTGLDAQLAELANGNASVSLDDQESYTLTRTFDTPHRVFYLPFRIEPERALSGGTAIALEPVKSDEFVLLE